LYQLFVLGPGGQDVADVEGRGLGPSCPAVERPDLAGNGGGGAALVQLRIMRSWEICDDWLRSIIVQDVVNGRLRVPPQGERQGAGATDRGSYEISHLLRALRPPRDAWGPMDTSFASANRRSL
jgi:hypothetical protein